jgi:nucleotidyltransferase substrate binding protein (TIGR01987 family)
MTNNDEIRWRQRLQSFEKANAQLQKACALESYSDLELAGLVQTYEFTFELAWKTMKDLFSYEGYEVASPRETIRQAFAAQVITDVDLWLEALDSRNRLSHTYDSAIAEEAEDLVKHRYAPMVERLLVVLRERNKTA